MAQKVTLPPRWAFFRRCLQGCGGNVFKQGAKLPFKLLENNRRTGPYKVLSAPESKLLLIYYWGVMFIILARHRVFTAAGLDRDTDATSFYSFESNLQAIYTVPAILGFVGGFLGSEPNRLCTHFKAF